MQNIKQLEILLLNTQIKLYEQYGKYNEEIEKAKKEIMHVHYYMPLNFEFEDYQKHYHLSRARISTIPEFIEKQTNLAYDSAHVLTSYIKTSQPLKDIRSTIKDLKDEIIAITTNIQKQTRKRPELLIGENHINDNPKKEHQKENITHQKKYECQTLEYNPT